MWRKNYLTENALFFSQLEFPSVQFLEVCTEKDDVGLKKITVLQSWDNIGIQLAVSSMQSSSLWPHVVWTI